MLSLEKFRGQAIDLVLITDSGPHGNDAADRAGWGLPWLMTGIYDARYGPSMDTTEHTLTAAIVKLAAATIYAPRSYFGFTWVGR
jgi:hypothetical protein